jgi:hypothetical protein
VEGEGVGTIEGDRTGIGAGGSLLEVEDSLNLLVELVGCGMLAIEMLAVGKSSLTGVLGLSHNFAEKLREVRKVLSEEAGLEDDGLAGVRSSQLTTEQLGLAGDAKSGSALRVLRTAGKLAQGWFGMASSQSHLESESLKTEGQTRKGLVTSTSLGNDSELCRRSVVVPGSYLEARNVGGLEGCRRGSGSEGTAVQRLSADRLAYSLLGISDQG